MQNAESPLEVLDRRHHLAQTLHLAEHVDQWLRVIQSRQNLFGQRLLNVRHCLLLGSLNCQLRVLLHLHLANSALQSVDQVLVLSSHLRLLLHSKFSEGL